MTQLCKARMHSKSTPDALCNLYNIKRRGGSGGQPKINEQEHIGGAQVLCVRG